MQRVFLFLFALLTASTAFSQKVINDPNAQVRKVSSFHAVSVSHAFEVVITQSAEEALAVSANDPKDIANIKTTVENGVLKIR